MDATTWVPWATDFAVSGGISATAYGAAGFISAAAYTSLAAPTVGAVMLASGAVAVAPVVGVVVVGAGTAIGGHYAYEWAVGEVKEHFYTHRPMDPDAELAGRVVGSVLGGYFGIQAGYEIGFAWRYPNIEIYNARVRGLTEEVYLANKAILNRVQFETRSASLPSQPGGRRSELESTGLKLDAV
jgi:hypothetical protein